MSDFGGKADEIGAINKRGSNPAIEADDLDHAARDALPARHLDPGEFVAGIAQHVAEGASGAGRVDHELGAPPVRPAFGDKLP